MNGTTRGVFLTLDGIDGAGKGVQVERLHRLLASEGLDVVVTREPGGTALGETLRKMLLSAPMDMMTEVLLMFASRREHIKAVIQPALRRGAVVLCDRFTDSTFAYQGAGRGFDLDQIATLEGMVQEGLQPDLTLLFDVSEETAAARRARERAPDRFESQDLAFFKRVRSAYLGRAGNDPERFRIIDSDRGVDEVWNSVVEAVGEVLPRIKANGGARDLGLRSAA